MQLRDFVIANPHGIQTEDTGRHAAEQMRRHGFGAMLVYDRDQLVGMITDRDLAIGCLAAAHDAGSCIVREHMTADPITIDASTSVEEALRAMAENQVRRLVATDGGAVCGIVSLGDLAVRCPDMALVGRTLAQISEPIRQPLPV